jgi:hypothetical protein
MTYDSALIVECEGHHNSLLEIKDNTRIPYTD